MTDAARGCREGLLVVTSLKELNYSRLMAVYEQSNRETGGERWKNEPESRQLLLAEQEFYQYLKQVFFRSEGAVYLLWQVQGQYVSALRLESYRDGLLLSGLETAPGERGKGYAKALLRGALERFGGRKIYSHVSKGNAPSLEVHLNCGFHKILDHAVYADGSVLHGSVTLCSK